MHLVSWMCGQVAAFGLIGLLVSGWHPEIGFGIMACGALGHVVLLVLAVANVPAGYWYD